MTITRKEGYLILIASSVIMGVNNYFVSPSRNTVIFYLLNGILGLSVVFLIGWLYRTRKPELTAKAQLEQQQRIDEEPLEEDEFTTVVRSDEEMQELHTNGKLQTVKSLKVGGPYITAQGFGYLIGSSVQVLYLIGPVPNASTSYAFLAHMKGLKKLCINHCHTQPAMLIYTYELDNLRFLFLWDNPYIGIDCAQVKQLKNRLPQLEISDSAVVA